MHHIHLLQNLFDYAELQFEIKLGEGSFGTVWKCKWRSSPVAVKQVKNDLKLSPKNLEEFLAEADLMRNMKQHRNVVSFLGLCEDPLCIITEYCAKGSLLSLLYSNEAISISDTVLLTTLTTLTPINN